VRRLPQASICACTRRWPEQGLLLPWEITPDAGATLDLADEPRVAVLAALGHPARARIVRTLLADGPRGTGPLQEAAGLAWTGQLYHHLRSLTQRARRAGRPGVLSGGAERRRPGTGAAQRGG
jgi:hypothetical protein